MAGMTTTAARKTSGIDWTALAANWPTKASTKLGRDVVVGDALAFAPGRTPIPVARIEAEQHLQSALNMTYRIFYDFTEVGYALFDEQAVWCSAPARSVVEG